VGVVSNSRSDHLHNLHRSGFRGCLYHLDSYSNLSYQWIHVFGFVLTCCFRFLFRLFWGYWNIRLLRSCLSRTSQIWIWYVLSHLWFPHSSSCFLSFRFPIDRHSQTGDIHFYSRVPGFKSQCRGWISWPRFLLACVGIVGMRPWIKPPSLLYPVFQILNLQSYHSTRLNKGKAIFVTGRGDL
jgi:hypothetical protein